jgi:hypothetical protein
MMAAEMNGRSSRIRVTLRWAVMGAAGGVLAGLSPLSTAIAVGCVVTFTVGARLNTEASLAITAETVAAFQAAALATGAPTETLLGYPLTFIGLWAFGLSRRAFLLRAEQAERMLAETRRARGAEHGEQAAERDGRRQDPAAQRERQPAAPAAAARVSGAGGAAAAAAPWTGGRTCPAGWPGGGPR